MEESTFLLGVLFSLGIFLAIILGLLIVTNPKRDIEDG